MERKPFVKRAAVPYLILAAGGTGLIFRVLLYALGQDSHGLLPRYHLFHILSLCVTAVTGFAVVRIVFYLRGTNSWRRNFPRSVPAGIGTFLAAGWLLMVAFALLEQARESLDYLLAGFSFAGAASLCYTGYCRMVGKRPFFLAHGALTLFLALYTLCQYRRWSANPQVPDYLYQVFACVFLLLTAYYRTAFDVGVGKRRLVLLSSLMAVYFCFLSLVGDGDGRFYFGGGIWALINLPPLELPPDPNLEQTITFRKRS